MKFKIGDICEIVSGSTPKTTVDEYWDGDIKWITPAEITDDSYIVNDSLRKLTMLGVKKAGLTSFPAGTVILSSRAPIGKVAIAGCEMYCNQGFKNLICSDRINNKYLYWFLKKNISFLNSIGRGATFKEISKKILSDVEINLPDIECQERKALNLEQINKIISLRKKELKEFNNLIKARFVEMFWNPANNEKGFIKAPMGDYMTVLTDFSSNGSYKTLDSGVTMYDEPNYAWMVRTTDLESGDMTAIKYIDEEAYELLAKSKIYGGEIIMNKIGSAGKIYLMPQIDMPASLGRNAFMFRYDDRINVKFLYHLLTSEYGQREIQQYVRGAVTKTITKNDVRAVLIIVPPIELQNEFESFVAEVDKSKVAVQKALDEAQILFDSLMQEYFG